MKQPRLPTRRASLFSARSGKRVATEGDGGAMRVLPDAGGRLGPSVLFCDDRILDLERDPRYKAGGATKQAAAWIDGLRRAGAEVKLLSTHAGPEQLVDRTDIVVSFDPDRGVPKLRYLYIRIPGVIRGIRRAGSDWVYYGVPSAYAGVLGLCAKSLGKKFVLRVSNDMFADRRGVGRLDPFRRLFFKLGFRTADFILCQNEYQARMLSVRYGKKVRKIRNPFSGEVRAAARPLAERDGICWVGIYQYQKNLPLLLEIARQLTGVKFRIAGEGSKALDREDQFALEALRRLPNVKMLGFLDRQGVLELLAESHCLLNTSRYEGFSNTYLEAFACGTPVLTPPQNDPDGIVQQHRLGRVYMSPAEAADFHKELTGDPELLDTIAENCLRYMREHHDIDRQAREFLRIIGGERCGMNGKNE